MVPPGVLLARDHPCGKCPWSAPSDPLAFPLLVARGCWLGLFQVMCPLLPHHPRGQCDLGGCSAFGQDLLSPFSILCWPWAPAMGNVTRTGSVGPWNQHQGGSWGQAQASYGLVDLLEKGEVHLSVVRFCAIPSSSN